MEKFSIREVIEQAVQTERLGYQFYTEMKDRFKDDQALVPLFTTLAQKELQHEKTFLGLKELVGDGEPEDWQEVEPYMRAIVESEFFLGKNKALPSMDRIKSVDDAVTYAMKFEKDTLLYFVGVKDLVREKELVDEIINEEKSHIMWLAAFRSNLRKA
jgi:rubrerythrin